MASTHVAESTTQTVRAGYLDPAAQPVAVIQPGDTVRHPITFTPVIEPGPGPDQAVARSVRLIIGPAALTAGLRSRRAVLPGRPGRG